MRDLASAQAGGSSAFYTTAQIEHALLSASTLIGCRFEVLDRGGILSSSIVLETLTGTPTKATAGGVLAASVSFDSTQAIRKSLTLRMFPTPGLLDKPLQYFIRAWFQLGMPDGGLCELKMGTYLWVQPQRTITQAGPLQNIEVWDVTLGDRQHLLDIQGPGSGGYYASGSVAQQIKTLLAYAQITDYSRVQDIGTALGAALSFSTASTSFGSGVANDPQASIRTHISEVYRLLRGVAADVPPDPPPPPALFAASGSAAPTTYNGILDTIMLQYGFDPGYFDFEDRYVAHLAVQDLAHALPTIAYTAETLVHPSAAPPGTRVDLIHAQASITPDPSQVANIIYVRAQYSQPGPSISTVNYNSEATAVITAQSQAITGLVQITNLSSGQSISGPGIPAGAIIQLVSGGVVYMNTNATASSGPSSVTYGVQSSVPGPSIGYQAIGASVDLNSVMPSHPMASRNIGGVYIPQTIDVTSTNDGSILRAVGTGELLRRATSYETVTLDTLAYPAHEGYELVRLTIPGDAQYSTPQLHKEIAWTMDLIQGTMRHKLHRIYQ